MKHNKITISILMIFVILLSVGCSNNQETFLMAMKMLMQIMIFYFKNWKKNMMLH